MRFWLTILCVIATLNLQANACPNQDLLQEATFIEPSDITWYDYAFIVVDGGAITEDDSEWNLQALYAPVDINTNVIDAAYKAKIIEHISQAKMSVKLKSSSSLDGKCFYQANNFLHIMFVATLKA